MASGNVDSSNSEDEILYALRKRRCKRKNVVNSDSENSSDCEIRPRATGTSRQICDSESSSDDESIGVNSSLLRKRHSSSGEACQDALTSVADSSDSEQAEKCVICLTKFSGQDVANPEVCDHTFCAVCLEEWAKKVNTCPIDRQEFNMILVRHHGETKISRTISFKTKANQSDEDLDNSEDSDYADVINCIVCGDSNEPNTIIMCNQCRLVYHRDCINPPLLGYPLSNPWQCPICRNLRLIVRGRFRPSGRQLALPALFDSSNNQLRSRSRNNTPNLNDSSSTDSSDENSEFSNSFNRRRQCQEIRNRRQSRIPRNRFNAPAMIPFGHSPLQQTDGFLGSMDSGDDMYDYSFEEESEGFLSRVRRRTHIRVKTGLLPPRSISATPLRPSPSAYSTSTDIVGDILQLQTALHTPGSALQRDGTLVQSTANSGQQCPLNPAHSTSSKCNNNNSTSQQNSSFAGSSSSSSGSGSSQCRDLYNMPACSMLQSNVNNDGYDTDSCSMVTHRSYGSSSVPEELKRDGRESFPKDATKTHSDEEVDIYSDIELTNEDETSLDTEMQAMSVSYKSDESHLATAVGDGSDSSDNDLVIDEDIQAEDDGEKSRCLSLNKSSDGTSCNSTEMIEKNASSSSELDEADHDDADQETSDKVHENATIHSPDHLDDASQSSNIHEGNDSCDSFKKSSDDKEQMNIKDDIYGDSEADSRDVNSTGNEADEENSIHSLKASGFEEHSEAFEPNNSSNGEESQKLSFNLESAASQMVAESQSNSQSSEDQQAQDVDSDCSASAAEINVQENDQNVSENEQELSADHFDNNFQNDVDMDSCDKSDGTHLEDSDCSGSSKSAAKLDSVNSVVRTDGEQLEYDYTNEAKSTSGDACATDAMQDKMSDENATVENSVTEKELEKEVYSPKNSVGSVEEGTPTQAFDNEDSACNLENGDEGIEDDDANSNKESSCIGSPEGDAENAEKSVDVDTENKEQDTSCVHSPGAQNIDDLGIEDISDAASDDLNQPENSMDCDQFPSDHPQSIADEVEKNVAQLFESDSPPEHNSSARESINQPCLEDTKRHSSSSRQSAQDDQEEGEIIDDIPYPKKENRHEYYGHEEDDFMDSTPRVNISDLPRIPKIKRDTTKTNEPEDLPLEAKRTSVLGRVDLGNSDISWKRLSQHTRERSYRDGRPKDESILFRDREPRVKSRKSKSEFNDRKNEDKYRESERCKKDDKKRDLSKSRERSSKDRKSDRTKGEHDKSSRQFEKSYSTPEKREKDKYGKSYDRLRQDKYDRDQSKSERESSKKEKREKYKDKSSREDDKYDRDKRAEEKYKRDAERYELSSDRYDRAYEKLKEKEYKHKHKEHRDSKDHKSDSSSSKKSKDEKRKHSHSSEHYSEKQKEREVRKVDDKLKIVVEHKEVKKDKSDKHFDKKHEKKHRDGSHHHHERKKKEHIASPYSDITPTPIESKEIFAKGDSIIINVNFNRASPREVFPPSASADEVFSREKKSSLSNSSKNESTSFPDESGKSKHPLHEKENIFVETSNTKRPSTPDERIEKNSTLSVGESYWRETDDTDANSPSGEKCSIDKNASDEENCTPVENYGADDNLTDSDDNDNLPETQLILSKTDDEFSEMPTSDRQTTESGYLEDKETDCFNNSRRRSPQPPSPPSPADNDSYDPCEPTRSPSPPPSPPPVPPPLPSKSIVDHPKPPPSPELPPLPPGPEPTDVIPRDDPRSAKTNGSSQPSEVMSVSSPLVTQQQVVYTQTTTAESSMSMPSVLMPPPSFPPRSTSMATTVQPQAMPPKTVNWQVPNPPPAPLMFPPNHVHPVIRGNFLPSHIPTMGIPPQNASATILPPTSSVPLMSQVRHIQMTTHGVIPNNQLIANVPLNIPQMHIPHMNHPSQNAMSAHHQLASMQSHPNSLSASNVVRVMPVQSQLPNIAVTIQNQHMVSVMQNQNMSHFITQQSQGQAPAVTAAHKPEKVQKSPNKEKSEVVDMDVDSPYSPGDSPSIDSNYDYSPPTSPIQKTPPSTQLSKDPFDTLLGPDRQDNNKMNKNSGKVRSSNCSDTPSKKARLDSKSDSSKSRHSVRLQVDKGKSRKEQKISEKKEILSKFDDTQLKILDELPSSAVEMQVKEKFLKKLNRQERVVEEVKMVLKPYYKTREVNKEEYKDILRKSVPKICHNKSGEINPVKVKHLVESYVKKVKHARKKSSKRHKASKYS